ncbi:hypothetical protein MMC24_005406 [Lignoscripta atroalba]|nr:hypothetical protein [Lignoscripta atroalba]
MLTPILKDHCLDNLRQYVMCHADISIMTFSWLPNFQRPWPDFDVTHECRNWDVVNEWAKGHSIDFFDEKVIKHPGYDPSLGNPWTDGGVASENAS